jgi:hypothetical protein
MIKQVAKLRNEHGGLAPPGPPFAHPRKLRVRQGFGSHPWRGFQSGLLAPSFEFVGGHPPQHPARGLVPPGPPLPTLASSGFAGVLGPTRGGVANAGNSLPLLNLWGDTPHNPPPGGLCPLDPLCPPSQAQGSPGFWVPLVAGLLMWATRPLF